MAARSLASNVMAKTILNVFNIALPLIVTRYVYHELGPFNMGCVQYALSIYNYFMVLGLFGISNYAIREISQHRNDKIAVRSIFKNMMVWSFISNLAALAVYIFFIAFVIEDPPIKILSWIMCINLLGQCFYLEWYHEAMEEFKFITLKTVIIRVASVLFTFMFVHGPEDMYIYMMIIVGVALFNYLVSFIYAQQKLHLRLKELFCGLTLRRFIVPLFTLMIINNSAFLFISIDTTIIGNFLGEAEVSYFSIGARLCEMMWTLLLSVVFATLPRLSLYLLEERHLYQDGVIKVMRMLTFMALPCGVALFMMAPELVDFFGGPEYVAGIPATRLFALRFVLLAIQGVMYNQIIFLHGEERVQLFLTIGCCILNVVLNIILVPILTPALSIGITIVCELIYTIINYIFISRKLKITLGLFSRYNTVYLLSALLFVPIIYGLQQLHLPLYLMFIAAIPACLVVYLGIMAWIRDEAYLLFQGYILKVLHIKNDK